MHRMRNVKIVATLGPSSATCDMIKDLFEAGAHVFRLNISHGDHDDIRVRHQMVSDLERDLNLPICILADPRGPKLRRGESL